MASDESERDVLEQMSQLYALAMELMNAALLGNAGDRTPSQLLRDMRNVCPAGLSDKTVVHCWAQKLPPALGAAVPKMVAAPDDIARCLDLYMEARAESKTSPTFSDFRQFFTRYMWERVAEPTDESTMALINASLPRGPGDRTPSQMLRHVRNVCSRNTADALIRRCWARTLPSALRAGVCGSAASVDSLAGRADRYLEACAESDTPPTPPGFKEFVAKYLWEQASGWHFESTVELLDTVMPGGIGDRKPSQLLRDMRDVCPPVVREEALRHCWMQRLPVDLRLYLTGSELTVDELGVLADRFVQISPVPAAPEPVFSASRPAANQSGHTCNELRFRELENAIKDLTAQVASLATALAAGHKQAAEERPS